METNKPESEYHMIDWWKKVVLENYANFEGRARRSEFWYFTLVNSLALIGMLILTGPFAAIFKEHSTLIFLPLVLGVLISLALFIPSVAVSVRRLHDIGKPGWWYLFSVIPIVNYIGGIVLLIFYCQDGEVGENQYGHDPKRDGSPARDFQAR